MRLLLGRSECHDGGREVNAVGRRVLGLLLREARVHNLPSGVDLVDLHACT